jgi:hypothetical protein
MKKPEPNHVHAQERQKWIKVLVWAILASTAFTLLWQIMLIVANMLG